MPGKRARPVRRGADGKGLHLQYLASGLPNNFVDAGTSTLLSAQVHSDFHAETALDAVLAFLRHWGRPSKLTFDRDPRWVGSASGRDFPSALVRFLLCLEIDPNICPPRRPDKNALMAYCTLSA
jgi:hypothetical protein